MRPWLVAAVWLIWLVVTAGVGYARAAPGDRIDEHATGVSARADLTLLAALVGAVAAALALPAAALPVEPWLTLALGAALVLLGLALRLWAARTLGRHFTRSIVIRDGHRVVSAGPYRFVRHPAYAGLLISLLGLGLTLGNWLSVALLVIGFCLADLPRIRAEEAALEAGLGERYRAYERGRKRLIPGLW